MDGWGDVKIDFTNWTRLPEIDAYARRRGQTREEAIMHLVNQGLSHVRWGQ